MILDFFSTLKDWFISIFERLSWFNLIPFLTGLIIGFILSALTYLVIITVSVRREQRLVKISQEVVDDKVIQKAILSAQNTYKEDSLNLSSNEKLAVFKKITWDLINDIAKMYYPKAKYPIYELSLDEILMLNHYITKRIEMIFSGKILRLVKKLKVSTIVKTLDLKKKLDENKLIKATQKATRSKPVKFIFSAINVLNPYYWGKKLFTSAIIPSAINMLANQLIAIVGEETKRVYSKNAFLEDEIELKVQEEVKELENQIEKGTE